jgi:hypothetical protein
MPLAEFAADSGCGICAQLPFTVANWLAMADYASMLLPGRRVVALWRTPVVNLRASVVMPATQRAAIVSWFQGASRTVVQSRRVSQLREWLRRVSAGSIAYLPHIYLSRLFFCLHLIITRLLSFFLFSFLFHLICLLTTGRSWCHAFFLVS